MKTEKIQDVEDFQEAMRVFVSGFENDNDMHDYILNQGVEGLELPGGEQRRFIELPGHYWRRAKRNWPKA